MAPPTPHLLGLPREIKDMIYQHLRQPKPVSYHLRDGNAEVTIEFDRAPLVNVLLIHPQITAEYLETFSGDISARFHFKWMPFTFLTLIELRGISGLLRHIKHATFIFGDEVSLHDIPGKFDIWTTIKAGIAVLQKETPAMATLRIAYRRVQVGHLHQEVFMLPRDLPNNSPLSDPPDQLGTLPILQMVHTHIIAGDHRYVVGCCGACRVGVYLYGNDAATNEQHFWSPEVTGKTFHMKKCERCMNEVVEHENAREATVRRNGLAVWDEKRYV